MGNGLNEFVYAEDFTYPQEKPANYGEVFVLPGHAHADKYDFNKDGHLDLIVNNYHSRYYIEGNGDGTFKTPDQIDSSVSSYAIATIPYIVDIQDMPLAEITSPD